MTITILGHEVDYSCDKNVHQMNRVTQDQIEEAIKLGHKSGSLNTLGSAECHTGKWWITDWKSIAEELHNALQEYTGTITDEYDNK